MIRGFASDNCSGVHPEVLRAIQDANVGHIRSYGDDHWTDQAVSIFKEHFGDGIEVFFVWNGTGANVVGLSTALRPFEAVICAETSHINTDECGAPERFTGCKLIDIPRRDGKLRPRDIEANVGGLGDMHHVQPRIVSITQSNELGLVYSLEETRALAKTAHRHGLYLHVDGARISNAAASLNRNLRELTRDCGVDVLSFGGTKNGMMYGEAIVIFNPELHGRARFLRKQSMQLASKMRFIAAQFTAMLSDDLWLRNARHANAMASLLGHLVSEVPGARLARNVEANGVFAILDREVIDALLEKYFFYVWDESTNEVRWITSFDTAEDDVRALVESIISASEPSRLPEGVFDGNH